MAEVAAGGGAPQEADAFSDDGLPFIRAGSLVPLLAGAELSSLEKLSSKNSRKYRLRLFPQDTVVFAKSGMSAMKGHVYRLASDAHVVNHLAAIIAGDDLDATYLEHTLRFVSPVSLVMDAAYPSIRLSDIANFEIPLPSLPEQRRIAAILDEADALRRKRRAAMERVEDLLDSLFLHMFVEKASPDWPTYSVADLATAMRTGPFGSQLLHSEFVDEGIAVLGIDNAVANEFRWGERRCITREKYNSLSRFRVFPGDVLITIMGTCGRAAIAPTDLPEAISTKHLCCITLDQRRCLPTFLHAAFLRHPSVLRQLGVRGRGAIMNGLNMQLIKELQIPLPALPLQQTFAARVAAIDALKAAHARHLARLDALFASLQHRAFAGEL